MPASRRLLPHLNLALAVLLAAPAHATDTPRFTGRVWGESDGLPIHDVGSIASTPDGYLWFGTSDGVVRFDGVRMTVFDAGNTDGLVNNILPELGLDARGRLWAWGMAPWVSVFDSSGVHTYGPESGIPRIGLRMPRFGTDGSVWLGMARGLYVLKDDRFELAHPDLADLGVRNLWITHAGDALVFPAEPARVLRDGRVTLMGVKAQVTEVCEGPDGTVWMAALDGLYRRSSDGKVERVAALPGTRPTAIGLDAKGGVWLGATTGLFRLARRSLERVSTTPVSVLNANAAGAVWSSGGATVSRNGVQVYRAPGPVTSIEPDPEGNVWLGTETAGVVRLEATTIRTLAAGTAPLGVAADPDGRIWIATHRGVAPADGGGPRYAVPGGASALTFDRDGTMWVAGAHLFRLRAGRLEPVAGGGEGVLDVDQTSDGAIWSVGQGWLRCLQNGAWRSFGPSDGTSAGPMQFGAESPDGTLWFTSPEGLLRFHGGRFDLITEADGLSSNRTRAAYVDHDGVVWVGTEGRGLNRLVPGAGPDGRPYSVRVIRERNGLHENGVTALAADALGHLWLGTNRGIGWISLDGLNAFAGGRADRVHMTVFSERNGLANGSVPAFGGALVAESKGVLYFTTEDGVARIDPATLAPDLPPPASIVEALQVGGDRRPAWHAVRLGPRQREFELAYTAPTFTDPGNIGFRYRLVGFRNDWQEVGTRRVAYFTNVPPGRYRFEVEASNRSGVWAAQPATLDIVVIPAWYESAWFRTLIVVMTLALLVLAYQARLRMLHRREHELAALVKERTREVEAEKETTEAARHAEAAERRRAEAQRSIAEEAMETAQRQAARLWEMDQAKSRFFANVSHEFRTPLTLTIGPLEDVESGMHGPVTDEARRELRTAIRSSRSVLDLVNQILELARLEAGQLPLNASDLDLGPLLRNTADDFVPLAERRAIHFSTDLGDRPLPVRGDPAQLKRVVNNLLTNAFKFTENGGTVALRARRLAETDEVEIVVRDSGIGIAPEELERIFDRFYQAHPGQQTIQPGTGIGLSLARELVELHGGRIEAESEKGSGSLFRVVLPAGNASAVAAMPPVTSSVESPAREPAGEAITPAHGEAAPEEDRPLVLLVEDHEEVRRLVRKHLASRYRIAEASDGEEALEYALRETPDLVISDVMMPRLDGFGLLRAMREAPDLDFVPLILLTARDAVEDRIAAYGIGADGYLSKPFHAGELVAQAESVIRTRFRLRERYRPLERKDRPPLRSADEAYVESVTRIIDEHLPDSGFNVGRLAHLLGQSRSQMFERVRATAGVPPAELIKRRRLEAAAEMLTARTGSVGEIAYAVGFGSVSHFSRAFRERYGRTPTEWGRGETTPAG